MAPMKSMLYKAWHTARWLDKTPLAWLLAPEVNSTNAGSVAVSCGGTSAGPPGAISALQSTAPPGPSTTVVVQLAGRLRPAKRSRRSWSHTSQRGCRSCKLALSSSPKPKLFSGAGMAPTSATAANATAHSGRLRKAIATRSPGCRPCSCCRRPAMASTAAKKRSKVQRSVP